MRHAEELARSAALAYRAVAHDLEEPAPTSASCGVLEVGVQDTPPGVTAGPALQARSARLEETSPTSQPDLALVHSLRGAVHLHRVGDLGLLTAALRPDGSGDREAVDEVAEAMTEIMNGEVSCTKGDLSARITPRLPSRLRAWCPTCRAEHVPDGLFRAASLPAGLRLQPAGNRSAIFTRAPTPEPPAADSARRELLRRYLRRCGPATSNDLAAWTGITPQAAKTWWGLLAADLVEIRVGGHRLWMHTEELAAAQHVPPVTAVRLLPPYDPLTEVAHRQLLLPDPAHRRHVWRAVANPGLVLVAGELVATWRRPGKVLTVTALTPLSAQHRQAIHDQATAPNPTETVTFRD